MKELVREKIIQVARKVKEDIDKGMFPELVYPPNSKANIKFLEEKGYLFEPKSFSTISGDRVKSLRTLSGVLYGLSRALDHLENGLTMTKRDFYYLHKVQKFKGTLFPKEQRETDARIILMELLLGMPREAFSITSDPRGWIYGDIELIDRSGRLIKANEVGEMGYSVPPRPENITFKRIGVKAVVAIEKVGPAKNMIELGIPEEKKIGIAILQGQASRNMRRFLRMLSDEGVPIAVLTDLSPWSLRIAATVVYNSINSAHVDGLAVPEARFIGIKTDDVEEGFFSDYKFALEPLTQMDYKAAEDNRHLPNLQAPIWQKENNWFLEKKMKAELEIFKAMSPSAKDLKKLYVEYLSMKLEEALGNKHMIALLRGQSEKNLKT
jgi:DNA topoisomerase-6 subunit A